MRDNQEVDRDASPVGFFVPTIKKLFNSVGPARLRTLEVASGHPLIRFAGWKDKAKLCAA